jgi:hypothetical protein
MKGAMLLLESSEKSEVNIESIKKAAKEQGVVTSFSQA